MTGQTNHPNCSVLSARFVLKEWAQSANPGPESPHPRDERIGERPEFAIHCMRRAKLKSHSGAAGAPKPTDSSADLIPAHASLKELRQTAAGCRACDLWKLATQTVFGEGLPTSKVMFVGEQPGDYEDRVGSPFVGPAGKLLDKALAEAGIDRSTVYVTNVVKHFKWAAGERGKKRIHKKPRYSEIQACRPWLDAELEAVRPEVLVCLGASAAQSLLGKDFRVTQRHGEFVESPLAPIVMATVHPSSILRAQDDESRHEQMQQFVADLRKIARLLEEGKKKVA